MIVVDGCYLKLMVPVRLFVVMGLNEVRNNAMMVTQQIMMDAHLHVKYKHAVKTVAVEATQLL